MIHVGTLEYSFEEDIVYRNRCHGKLGIEWKATKYHYFITILLYGFTSSKNLII